MKRRPRRDTAAGRSTESNLAALFAVVDEGTNLSIANKGNSCLRQSRQELRLSVELPIFPTRLTHLCENNMGIALPTTGARRKR